MGSRPRQREKLPFTTGCLPWQTSPGTAGSGWCRRRWEIHLWRAAATSQEPAEIAVAGSPQGSASLLPFPMTGEVQLLTSGQKSSFAHAEMNVRVLHQASEPKWVQWWSKSLLKHHAAGNKFRYLHTQWFKTYVGALILENLSVWPRGHSRGFPLRPIFLIPKPQFSNLTLILCDLYPDEDH